MFVLLLSACSDYDLNGSGDVQGKYNPPELGAQVQADAITQVTVPAVDVLWVIDNSCSMEEEQAALRDNFSSFIQYFVGSTLDWHVGVVTTDMADARQSGRLVSDSDRPDRYIDSSYSEADAIESFRQRAVLGTSGSGDEAGLDASFTALTYEADRTNTGFYRDEAGLSIVVISDEPDQSREVSTTEYISWLAGLKTDPDYSVTFSAIVAPDNSSCPQAERGVGYLEAAQATDGIVWPICTTDWASILEDLGLSAAGLKDEFYLSLVPVEETISVSVEDPDGAESTYLAGADWEYSRTRNSVQFLELTPLPLSVVHITYEVLATSQPVEEEVPVEE